jgi:hypothetical protein
MTDRIGSEGDEDDRQGYIAVSICKLHDRQEPIRDARINYQHLYYTCTTTNKAQGRTPYDTS